VEPSAREHSGTMTMQSSNGVLSPANQATAADEARCFAPGFAAEPQTRSARLNLRRK